MPHTISIANARDAIRRVCTSLMGDREELNRIDGQMGDGDIGITVAYAAEQILETLPATEDDFGKLLLTCAQVMTRSRASSFGTLMATGAMAMARLGVGKTEISRRELAEMLAAAVDKMALRGKASLGDKTVLDALDAVRSVLAEGDDGADLAAEADRAAETVLERFRGRPCRQGRARIFADRSMELDDPGMVVVKKMTAALRAHGGLKHNEEEGNGVPGDQ
jgi:phosphoenolpyruvate---glycerone phosphotransferase subunit DhaL